MNAAIPATVTTPQILIVRNGVDQPDALENDAYNLRLGSTRKTLGSGQRKFVFEPNDLVEIVAVNRVAAPVGAETVTSFVDMARTRYR